MNKKIPLIIMLLILLGFLTFSFVGPNTAKAASYECGILPQDLCNSALGTAASSSNPLGGLRPILDFIANILVAIVGMAALLVLIVSGVQISASAGNENVIKKAKENIFRVVTAMVLLISFRAILGLIEGLFVFDGGPINFSNSSAIFTATGINTSSGPIAQLFINIVGLISFASGVVSVIFVIIGGVRYTTSGGSPNALTSAKKTITYALAGLVLSISAYGILQFIQNQLQK